MENSVSYYKESLQHSHEKVKSEFHFKQVENKKEEK